VVITTHQNLSAPEALETVLSYLKQTL